MAKIAIDAGHCLSTPGKRCLKALDANETREWVLNDRVARALEIFLQSAGHTTKRVDDATGKNEVSLANRVKAANEWDADYLASIHHNAGIKGGKGGGTVVYVYGKGATTLAAQKAIYENAILRGDLKGNRSNGTPNAGYYVCRYSKMPASLTECGFMDSSTDIKKILDPEWSKRIALGIAEGICDVFGGVVDIYACNDKPAPAEKTYYRPTVLQWQNSANADGFIFPKYGKDGKWGKECEGVAKKAVVKKRLFYTNKYLTKIVQQVVGAEVDGKCGKDTDKKIRAWQKAVGLPVTGAIGLVEWKKILGIE